MSCVQHATRLTSASQNQSRNYFPSRAKLTDNCVNGVFPWGQHEHLEKWKPDRTCLVSANVYVKSPRELFAVLWYLPLVIYKKTMKLCLRPCMQTHRRHCDIRTVGRSLAVIWIDYKIPQHVPYTCLIVIIVLRNQRKIHINRDEARTAVTMKITIFWDEMFWKQKQNVPPKHL